MSFAYYSENDPYAARWLVNLIGAGLIAPGIVDQRSISDVTPNELRGFTQCHFFAGIGVWSYALRRAGWPDDVPVWTGSAPCQPFSAAGKGAGVDDERHLWPHWHHLIRECRPAIVLGEQVASKDGLGWLDLVSSDLEGEGYAVGASDLCAAGFGGAHIRQRLYFVGMADSASTRCNGQIEQSEGQARDETRLFVSSPVVTTGGMADAPDSRQHGWGRTGGSNRSKVVHDCEHGGMADADGGNTGSQWKQRSGEHGQQPSNGGVGIRLGHTDNAGSQGRGVHAECGDKRAVGPSTKPDGPQSTDAPMLGRNPADWLYCRDGKWRPVEPGTFPLADAAPARVGRLCPWETEAPSRVGLLRAYGNGLDAETATTFVSAVMECRP